MSRFLGEDFPAFEAALEQAPLGGLRINTLKIPMQDFLNQRPFPLGESIPWCDSAFLLPAQERPGKHPYHGAGLYYLQDPSAMAPASLLGPQPGERVLDLAAAPGGKTTQIAALMQGRGLLVANEIKGKRLGHLVMNVERWGAGNVLILNETPERLADHFGASFDRVLVDAPCSGEGMFRKDMGARQDWSLQMVAGCAQRQRNILRVAAHLVRPGGFLLYSTCTFAPEEDEGVISDFMRENPDFSVKALPRIPGFQPGRPDWLPGTHPSLERAVRLFPHKIPGEGHFICLLERGGNAPLAAGWNGAGDLPGLNRVQTGIWEAFSGGVLNHHLPFERLRLRFDRLYLVPEEMPDTGDLRLVHPGVWLGTFKQDRFDPAHPLALALTAGDVKNGIDLKPGDPLLSRYLRGETFPSPGEPGWVLISVDGFGLGWGKRVQGTIKNHYPRGWM